MYTLIFYKSSFFSIVNRHTPGYAGESLVFSCFIVSCFIVERERDRKHIMYVQVWMKTCDRQWSKDRQLGDRQQFNKTRPVLTAPPYCCLNPCVESHSVAPAVVELDCFFYVLP